MNSSGVVIGSLRKYRVAQKLKCKETDHQFKDNSGKIDTICNSKNNLKILEHYSVKEKAKNMFSFPEA